MKKLASIASTVVVALGLMGGVAAADTNCNGTISTTGTGSTNTVTCVDNNNDTVKCTNNVVVKNDSDQEAESGNANNSGNTTSGGATSGDTSNDNSTVVNVGASCNPTEGGFTVADTPTTPTAPAAAPQVLGAQVTVKPVGGVGAGAGAAVQQNQAGLIAGGVASLATVGLGFVLRKRLQA